MPTMLTDEEKTRIRYFLGYPIAGPSGGLGVHAGMVIPLQTLFLLESSMEKLTAEFALNTVRDLLAECERAECDLRNARPELSSSRVGSTTLRGAKKGERATDLYEGEVTRFAQRLADALGVPLYRYAKRFEGGSTGTVRSLPVRN